MSARLGPAPQPDSGRVPPSGRGRARLLGGGLVALIVCGVGLGQLGAAPLLHEFFRPRPEEDLRFGATTPNGGLPAAVDTPSGLVRAPDDLLAKISEQTTYGGASTQTSLDASYRIDRLTTAPDRVKYDEPFRPSILPFKRLFVFDRVNEDLSLGVADSRLTQLSIGGSAETGEDVFFGDFEVDLLRGVPVRIPSVAAGARILSLHTDPEVPLEISRDSAENWFARADFSGRVRVVSQLASPRAALLLGELSRDPALALLAIPAALRAPAERVQTALGLLGAPPNRRTLDRLVAHFRAFAPTADLPKATSTAELYVELSLSQKGVCRHRAYAFLLTALSLQIPARMVHNEAHAWVEVHDGSVWHRIDLGGAPAELEETRPDPDVPEHRPPTDPFAWPEGSSSGSGLAVRTRQKHQAASWPSALGAEGEATPSAAPSSSQGASAGVPPSEPGAPASSRASGGLGFSPAHGAGSTALGAAARGSTPHQDETQIRLELVRAESKRGEWIEARGEAKREGRVCALARIDLVLETALGERALGSLATDRRGRFSGPVLLPFDVPAGPHFVRARIGAGCD